MIRSRVPAQLLAAAGVVLAAAVALGQSNIQTKRVQFKRGATSAVVEGSITGDQIVDYVVVTEPLNAAMRREAGRRSSVMTEAGAAPYWLRWLSDDRAVFAGGRGKPVPSRQRDKAIVMHTADLMYALSVRYPAISGRPAAWGWRVPIVSTADGLPWIGAHRNFPFHFFAVAFGWHGDALAWLASLASLVGVSLEDAAARYANGCPRCGDKPCACVFVR